ncbi:hypothetical protein [Amycolatopsis sp. 195334CR]|uniref:hypothetical protein n=1 Tax=Amycolatopsis sp. 195334CR TaxID=2814588 RepID=UPI001A8EE77A|nr:hypothetical protein [Amycolatopsis sp. 195334CR]MBN6036540.1 hypothetical protein [Amycolatopsis sp. 195334CR]
MTQRDKTLLIVLGFLAVFAPVTAGLSLAWPTWLWVLITVASVGAVLVVRAAIAERIRGEQLQDARMSQYLPAEPVPEPSEYEEVLVGATYLPSASADYRFVFSAKVWWRFTPGRPPIAHANPAGLAISLVVRQAQHEAVKANPEDYSLLEHHLSGVLGTTRQDPGGVVEASANSIKVSLAPDDEARLRSLADVRKNREVWEHEREYERNKRQYLGEDVLKDTGSAVVWWLAKKDTAIQETVDLIGNLAQLSAAANNTEIPPLFRNFLMDPQSGADLNGHAADTAFDAMYADADQTTRTRYLRTWMTEIGLDPGDPEWSLLAHRLARSAETTGRPDIAEEIRRDFDLPTDTEPDAPADQPGDDTVDTAEHTENEAVSWPADGDRSLSYE